jgi:hypothetical protein
MPSAKFIFPPNFEVLAKGRAFTIQLAINHLETGWFTNPDTTYMSAPLAVNSNGDIMGHTHVVVEKLTGFGQTIPTYPKEFVFFKGLNLPVVNGVLSTNVTGGLPAGYYRIAVLHSGANHQPSERYLPRHRIFLLIAACESSVATPVAQRGALGDMVYVSAVNLTSVP